MAVNQLKKSTILLFDIDGTLTNPRQKIGPRIVSEFEKLRQRIPLGVVGGSDFAKVREQLGDNVLEKFDYVFSENGLVGFKHGTALESKSMLEEKGEATMQKFLNFCFAYMSKLELPAKRGNFVEFRRGMLNISPIGRSCSQKEREEFVIYDKEHKVREKMIAAMRAKFPPSEFELKYSIGGQISIDVFPIGWDKTFCLQFLLSDGYDTIHFFGDKILPGGNDHEIYEDPRTIGHGVESPDDTLRQVKELIQRII